MTRSVRRHLLRLTPAIALLLGVAAAQAPSGPPAPSPPLDAVVRDKVMPRIARVRASEPGDGRVEQASGFVIDRYNRLVLTSCRILFSKRETLSIEVEFAGSLSVKRAANALLCHPALDLAIVHVRAFDIEFPPPVDPAGYQTWPGDTLYVLGFTTDTPTVIPVTMEAADTELSGLPGRFVRTRSKPQPGVPDVEDALHNLAELAGGPLVNAQGRLIGVNAFSSAERIKHAPSGADLGVVPKGTYLAHTAETVAPLVREMLRIRP
jgi:S1-C subfamily serine protease